MRVSIYMVFMAHARAWFGFGEKLNYTLHYYTAAMAPYESNIPLFGGVFTKQHLLAQAPSFCARESYPAPKSGTS